MRSKKVEVHMPWSLYEACVERAERRKFKSLARYFVELALRDVIAHRRQDMDAAIANADPNERDELIDHVLSRFPTTREATLEQIRVIKDYLSQKHRRQDGTAR